ncbi:MAG: TonB-dependent receptor plug domain-containing protein [Gammaproteobacteria bacterium]
MVLRRMPAVLLPLGFLSCCPLFAADETVELEPIIVTATRLEMPLDQIPASVSVVEGEDIERAQVVDVLEVLRDIPGFTIVQTGSRGGTTSLFARGGNSNFNQVLIDGVKVNQAGGAFDFDDLTTDGVHRIEIVRGPQSALYGSDAITSVVQLFTRRGDGPLAARFGFAGGEFETFEEKASISGGTERYGYTVDVGRIDTDGILDFNNRYGNTTVASRFDWSPVETLDLTTTVRFNDSRFDVATQSAGDRFSPLDPNQSGEKDRLIVGPRAVWNPYPWWRHALQLGLYREDRSFDDPFDPSPDPFDPSPDFGSFVSDTSEERLSADYNSTFFLPSVAGLTPTMTLGGYAEGEDFEQDSLFLFQGSGTPDRIDESRDTQAFYSQLILDWREQVTLVAGFRLDEGSTFGTEVNPRVGMAYRLPAIETKLRASYGTGIKAPTFFENFVRSAFAIGNPDLDPERSESWEVGLDQPLPFDDYPGELSVTYFSADFDDLIGFVFRSTPSFNIQRPSFFNIQRAQSRGLEVGLRVVTPIGIGLRGSYTYLDTEVVESGPSGGTLFVEGEPLLRRPEHSGAFTIDYAVDRWTASFNLTIKGSSIDGDFNADPAARVRLDGYAKADIALAYRLFENRLGLESFSITAKGQNVFDEDYEEVFGFSTAGASFLIGFRAEM